MNLDFFPTFFGETFKTTGKCEQRKKTAVEAASALVFRDRIKPKDRVKQVHKPSKQKHAESFKKAVQPGQMETQKKELPLQSSL